VSSITHCEYFVLDDSPSVRPNNNNTSLVSAESKLPLCRGNACPHCGKCFDWYYDGTIDGDYERFKHRESHDIYNAKRWHRRPNGPSVTCSYFYPCHFGIHGVYDGFDICRCP
jgi:hypothetical protein